MNVTGTIHLSIAHCLPRQLLHLASRTTCRNRCAMRQARERYVRRRVTVTLGAAA